MTRRPLALLPLAALAAAMVWTATIRAEDAREGREPAPAASASAAPVLGADATVTLPLSEFELLVAAGESQSRRSTPPFSWAVRDATYACDSFTDTANGLGVRVNATLKLAMLGEGYQVVPIGGGGTIFEKALLDGNPVVLVAPEPADRIAVLVPTRGPHTLELAFTTPVQSDPTGAHRVQFNIARSPVNHLTLELDQAPARIQAQGGVVSATAKRGKRTEIQMVWPPVEQVTVAWQDPAPAPIASPSAAPAPVVPKLDAQLTSRFAFRTDRVLVDASAVLSVRQGALPEFRFNVPAGVRLLRVRESNGETTPRYTTTAQPDGSTRLVIKGGEPMTGEHRYHLELEQTFEPVKPPSDVAPHGPAPASPAASPAPASPSPATTASASASPAPSPAAAPGPAASPSVASTPASTAVTAPNFGPPTTVPLAFVSVLDAEQPTGEFTLITPSPPLHLEQPVAREPVKLMLGLGGSASGWSFSYTGAPVFPVTLDLQRVSALPGCWITELHARTLVLPEGGLVTRATFKVQNRREPSLTLALPPKSEVLTAFLDGDPAHVGARNPADANSPGHEVHLAPSANANDAPAASNTNTPPVGPSLPVTTAPAPKSDITTPAWVEIVVPLHQNNDHPNVVEVTYRETTPALGSRERVRLRAARAPYEIGEVHWDVDVPPGWQARAVSESLKAGDAVELKALPATATATAPRALEPSPATTAAALPMGWPPARFDLPDPGAGSRIALTADQVKPSATPEVEVVLVSQSLQQAARTLVFLLTLLALADLFWIGLPGAYTVAIGVALAVTVLVSLVLSLGVMWNVVAGVVAALTFKLIRLLMDPVEEKESS